MGFEPTRAEHNGLAVHRLNHSATSSAHNRKKKSTIISLLGRATVHCSSGLAKSFLVVDIK